jgi:hypothetical protein
MVDSYAPAMRAAERWGIWGDEHTDAGKILRPKTVENGQMTLTKRTIPELLSVVCDVTDAVKFVKI